MKIQTLLNQLIWEKGMTQAEISRETGIPQARLSRWVAGKAPQSVSDALLLAKLASKVKRK